LLFKLFDNDSARLSGVAMAGLGLAIFVWSKLAIVNSYSPCYDSFVPHNIVERGPYRYVRHPIYSGNLLFLAGLFIASGSLWLAANFFILLLYYYRAAIVEERVLSARFPKYAVLMARTGRFLPGWHSGNSI
jgi:protein-S-isoprenylcysteine O-methyltransferase Ste14